MSVIEARNIEKSYVVDGVETKVLKGVDLSLEQGESLCLVGPSGAGKSTLLYLLGCLERPTRGQVIIEGRDMGRLGEEELSAFRNTRMGFVFQFHHLLPDFTALENVMMPLLIRGDTQKKSLREAQELLEEVGLSGRAHHKPSQLSGGEQQRIAVARALVTRPPFVFADEPTGNLDHENGMKVFDLLLGLNRELRSSLIVVTHNESVAGSFNRKLRLLDGVIHQK